MTHAMTLPRIWPEGERPKAHIGNALQILELAERLNGLVVLDPLEYTAIVERLTRAIQQLENA